MRTSAEPAVRKNVSGSDYRALFLTHAGMPGGAEYKMLTLCRQIPKSEVLTFSRGELTDKLAQLGIPADVCAMPDAMGQVRRENGIGAIFRAIPPVLGMLRKVAAFCRNYDVLVPMSQKAFMVVALAKPLHRKPIVWYMNDLMSRDHFSPMMMRVLIHISRLTTNHIIFNSQASLQSWVDAGGRSNGTSVSFSGINVASIDEQLGDTSIRDGFRQEFSPDDKPLVGIIGRLSPWKGQDIFLQALARIPDVRGVIVGDALFGESDYADSLKRMAEDLGLGERVTFAGHREDVVSVMAACDVVAHCSTAPEPFGRVIVEAMLAETPVIASNAGGAKEIVINGETGFLTPLGGVQALSEAIAFYLHNPEKAMEMATEARLRAERHFSSEAMVNHLKHILAEQVAA